VDRAKVTTVVPAEIPLTTPDEDPIVINAEEVFQVPPVEVSLREVVNPAQTEVAPVIGPGKGLIEITALSVILLWQPVEILVAVTV
jgi:hypothetical protein